MKIIQEEAGYSLLETSVSLALLSVVLLPLVAFLVEITISRKTTIIIEAQQLAQEVMETTLASRNYTPLDSLGNAWHITRAANREGMLVMIQVSVTHRNSKHLAAHFTTIRPAKEDNK